MVEGAAPAAASVAWAAGDEEIGMANEATVVNQREILANQRKILANQKKLDRVLANQARILANQKKILNKRGK